MKRLNAAVLVIALTLLVSVAVWWNRDRIEVNAEETASVNKPEDGPRIDQRKPNVIGSFGDRAFPIFFVEDVIKVLSAGAERLVKQQLAKNSDDLRKDLHRTRFPLKLPRPLATELSTQDHYQRAAESVFLVAGLTRPGDDHASWQTAFSTAFVVHADGILSTSAHVFDHDDHDDAVVALDVRGKVHPVVEVLAMDRLADTCLFRIGTKGLKPLPLGKEVPPGTPIRVMGHPGDSFFFFSAGIVANYERDEDERMWLNVTADFGQGSSGGPVMDAAGNVVGQVSRTYTLYAAGETSRRRRTPRTVRQTAETDADKVEMKKDEEEEKAVAKKRADPQMVFKACTPVTAIRALVE